MQMTSSKLPALHMRRKCQPDVCYRMPLALLAHQGCPGADIHEHRSVSKHSGAPRQQASGLLRMPVRQVGAHSGGVG